MQKKSFTSGPSARRRQIVTKTLLIMRLTTVFLFAAILGVHATGVSQKISFSGKNVPLKKILTAVKKQTGYVSFYRQESVAKSNPVTISADDMPLVEFMNAVLKDQPLSFRITNKTIILSEKAGQPTSFFGPPEKKKFAVISGRVLNEEGEPLEGVSIAINGAGNVATTNSNGEFHLQHTDGTATLSFSYTGYSTVKVFVSSEKPVTIILKKLTQQLDDVVIVGYTRQKKLHLTGSVASINGDEIQKRSSPQLSTSLQGIAPGVTVTRSNGQPGSGATIRVRGINTLGDGSKMTPLVMIDGVPVNSINDIDPNDVESISVLKDAASASIYGARAAGGVILITTKRAKAGTMTVNYGFSNTWQKPTYLPEFEGGYEYMNGLNEALRNENKPAQYAEEYINSWRDSTSINPDKYPSTNWYDALLKKSSLLQTHHLRVAMGTDKMSMAGSLGYTRQDGIMPNTGFDRYNFRLNTNFRPSSQVDFNFDLSGISTVSRDPSSGISNLLNIAKVTPPIMPVRFSDGRWGSSDNGLNAVAQATDGGISTEKLNYAILNISSSYRPVKGLELNVSFAPSFNFDFYKTFNNPVPVYHYYSTEPAFILPQLSSLVNESSYAFNYYLKGLATYRLSIADKHHFNLLGGYEQILNNSSNIRASRDRFPLTDYQVLSAGSLNNQTAAGNEQQWRLRSFFGRFNYNFKERYLLEGNIRVDGSSRLAANNKYDVFPSVSAGWLVSSEPFMRNARALSTLKLRASWGELGNQNIGLYPFASTIDITLAGVRGGQAVSGAGLTTVGNPNIGWERTQILNFGVDAAFFRNKLSFEADYFIKTTKDILLTLPISNIVGLAAGITNAGEVQNKGYDISLNYKDQIGDFKFGIGLVYSDVINKVIDLKGTGPSISGINIITEGSPINSLYFYQADGLIQEHDNLAELPKQFGTYGPGDIKYVDISGPDGKPDGVINATYDRRIFGNTYPRKTYAINLTGEYKGFDASIFFRGVGEIYKVISGASRNAFAINSGVQSWQMDHWTPENPGATYPRYTFSNTNNQQESSYWMRNASYLRLGNIQLGYNMPKSLLGKTFIRSCRVYVSGQDILTFDRFYPGFDPENADGSGNSYPFSALYTVGVNVGF